MKITENKLRETIRLVLQEMGDASPSFKKTRYMPSGLDRKLSVSSVSKSSASNTDAVKLMSINIGFFQALINDIKFKMLSREQINKICNSLRTACENNFENIVVVHPCLRVWREDVMPLIKKIDENSEFKADFCESVKSNCEMIESNFTRAFGNFPNISL
jgi:hypothetical protein